MMAGGTPQRNCLADFVQARVLERAARQGLLGAGHSGAQNAFCALDGCKIACIGFGGKELWFQPDMNTNP